MARAGGGGGGGGTHTTHPGKDVARAGGGDTPLTLAKMWLGLGGGTTHPGKDVARAGGTHHSPWQRCG